MRVTNAEKDHQDNSGCSIFGAPDLPWIAEISRSAAYWEKHYQKGGNSGPASYGHLPNKYPYTGDAEEGFRSDFFIYGQR